MIHSFQADLEYKLFSDVLKSVENLYQGRQPLHHLPSARSVAWDPQSSIFFIATSEEFSRLSPIVVQEIFRHRNIVVTGVQSADDIKFDRDGLRSLGSLTAPREMHGEPFSDSENVELLIASPLL